jgi:threonine aldolase
VSRYAKETLAEVIDGAAEGYLANGFAAAAMAVYAFARGTGPVEVSAEAHRFEREAGARAQAEAERPRRAERVPGVEGAISDGAVLLAVAGRDLLKLTVVTPGAGGPEALVAIAAAWRKEQGP